MTSIDQSYVDLARTRLNNGDVSGAYQALADGGDSYAAAAAALTADTPSLLGRVVEKYWDKVYGPEARQEKWDDVAETHAERYLQNIEDSPTNLIPNTVFIEDSYALSLEDNGLSRDGAIDLAINQLTQPLTIPLDEYMDRYLPGESYEGYDATIDMPDWHSILEILYGDFGDRQIENSQNFTQGSWEKALFDLSISGLTGGLEWLLNETPLENLPEAVLDSLKNFTPENLANLPRDYQWAFENSGAIIDQLQQDLQDLADQHGLQDLLDSFQDSNGDGIPDAIPPELYNLLKPLYDLVFPKSPLVLDTNFSGSVNLTTLGDTGTYFDLDGNGQAELTAWTKDGDGLLAIDLNGNGEIDNGLELFGTAGGAEDGFAALRPYDTDGDGEITNADAQWSDLLVWIDANMDGYSQEGELHTLDDLGITGISLSATVQNNKFISGNQITHEASFTTSDGQTYDIVDAWFDYDAGITRNAQDYDFDIRAAFLPTLRGFGDLKDTYVAASIDNTGSGNLLDMLTNLTLEASDLSVFDDFATFSNDVETFLLNWAGVEAVDPNSRGSFVDARYLEFYEAFTGTPFLQYGQPNPRIEAGAQIEAIFDYIKDFSISQILAQTIGADIFEERPSYSLFNGAVEGDMILSQDGIDGIEAIAASSSDPVAVWTYFAQFIGYTKGLENLTAAEISILDTAISNTNEPSLSDWTDVVARMIALHGDIVQDNTDFGSFEVNYDSNIIGAGSGETLTGSNDVNDRILGQGGGDTLIGLGGHDKLDGGDGNDILDGGLGDDYVLGGYGNDTYIYLSGNDTFFDTSGTDIIQVEASTGLTVNDVSDIYRIGTNLVIQFSTGDELTVDNHFGGGRIEDIEFLSDNSSLALDSIDGLNTYGDAASNVLSSASYASSNIIYGYGGNDRITGRSSADTFYGGSGSDFLDGLGGDDFLYGGTGDDRIEGGSGNDKIYGEDGNDNLRGEDGNDEIYGGAGDDYIDAGYGNDILDGGDGNDTLYSGAGYATYIASNGNDQIWHSSGSASIIMQDGFTQSDLTFTRVLTSEYANLENELSFFDGDNFLSDDLLISWGNNSITIRAQYSNSSGGSSDGLVNTIEFSDNTVLDLSTLVLNPVGTEENDYLNLSLYPSYELGDRDPTEELAFLDYDVYGYGGNDLLAGGYGNDNLFGGDGDDTYYISFGSDFIYDTSGYDIIVLPDYDVYYNYPEIYDIHNFSAVVEANNDVIISFVDNSDFDITFKEQADETNTARVEELQMFWQSFNFTTVGKWIFGTVDNAAPETLNGDIYSGFIDDVIFSYSGDDNIYSYTGNDQIYAGEGDDYVEAGDGNDYVEGHLGNDIIFGGDGSDTLSGGQGINNLLGDAGDDIYLYSFIFESGTDIITESSGFDTITLYTGDDISDLIFTQIGDDLQIAFDSTILIKDFYSDDTGKVVEQIMFGDGSTFDLTTLLNDTFTGTSAAETFDGGTGNDTVDYSASLLAISVDLQNGTASGGDAEGDTLISIENIIGSNEATPRDYIWGDANANHIQGMDGYDILEGGAGADIIDGGNGWDYARYTRSDAGVTINLTTGVNTGGHAQGDQLISIEAIVGSSYNDSITGSNANDYLIGGAGNDTLDGAAGFDQLYGDAGDDIFYFAGGTKIINETTGTDRVIFDAAFNPENAVVSDNFLSFIGITDTVSFNDITLIEGFEFHNTGSVIVIDLATLQSYHPELVLNGDENDNVFYGTSDAETFNGLDGIDTVDYSASQFGVTVDLEAGTGSSGDAAGDTYNSIENVTGSDITNITGSNANDYRDWIWGDDNDNVIKGLAGNDILEGGAGADTLNGGDGWDYARYLRSDEGVTINLATGVNTGGHAEGDTLISIEAIVGSNYNDSITGGASNDYLKGELGDDILAGGAGLDTLFGGAGADTFLFDGMTAIGNIDKINDFNMSQGDKIDIVDVLSPAYFDPLTQALTDFVRITDDGVNSTLSVDVDGGADNFVAIATIYGVTGITDEDALVTSGNLVTV